MPLFIRKLHEALDGRLCDSGLCWWDIVASSQACRAFIEQHIVQSSSSGPSYAEAVPSPLDVVPKHALVVLDELTFTAHVLPKLSKSARLRSFMRQ